MPRDGSGVYHRPVGTDAVPDTTIESAKYNVNVADVESDLNLPRPIVAGGTNATSVDAALTNLSAAKAQQVVTDFNSAVLVPGTFNASTASTNSPVGGHAFSGLVYGPDTNNRVIEARDSTTGIMYVRIMTAGVWGAWTADPTAAAFVKKAGDVMTGQLTVVAPPVAATDAAAKSYVDSTIGTQAVRYDTAQTLTAVQQKQARANIAVNDGNVIINGDFRINQIAYVSAAVLASGSYGHDQWKAGASGGDYSFTQLKSSTQITIAAGKSLIQPIEDVNVAGGSYVLSWTGTAQARAGINTLVPTGSYAASPLLITGQTADTAMSVEFNTGTLGTVKLESGAIATPFVARPYDQELVACKRYWQKLGGSAAPDIYMFGYTNNTGLSVSTVFTLPVEMRAVPTVALVGTWNTGNVSTSSHYPGTRTYSYHMNATAAGQLWVQNTLGAYIKLDARL